LFSRITRSENPVAPSASTSVAHVRGHPPTPHGPQVQDLSGRRAARRTLDRIVEADVRVQRDVNEFDVERRADALESAAAADGQVRLCRLKRA